MLQKYVFFTLSILIVCILFSCALSESSTGESEYTGTGKNIATGTDNTLPGNVSDAGNVLEAASVTTAEAIAGIAVTNDTELAAVATGGEGTIGNPYIIDGLLIVADGTDGISITGTTKYFIIQNCRFSTVTNSHSAVLIDSIAAHTATIKTNLCQNYENGIKILNTDGVNLVTNTCTDNKLNGIYLDESENCVLTGNYCSDTSSGGIAVYSSSNTTLDGNTCNSSYNFGIYLSNSGSSTLINNTCNYHNYYGIYLSNSDNSTLTGNTCTNNNYYGISLNSSNCVIAGNILETNGYGVRLTANSQNNLVYNNDFIDNNEQPQACDDGTDNQWYDAANQVGNFWSDYSGQGAYEIAGTTRSTDIYPEVPATPITVTITITSPDYDYVRSSQGVLLEYSVDVEGGELTNLTIYIDGVAHTAASIPSGTYLDMETGDHTISILAEYENGQTEENIQVRVIKRRKRWTYYRI